MRAQDTSTTRVYGRKEVLRVGLVGGGRCPPVAPTTLDTPNTPMAPNQLTTTAAMHQVLRDSRDGSPLGCGGAAHRSRRELAAADPRVDQAAPRQLPTHAPRQNASDAGEIDSHAWGNRHGSSGPQAGCAARACPEASYCARAGDERVSVARARVETMAALARTRRARLKSWLTPLRERAAKAKAGPPLEPA